MEQNEFKKGIEEMSDIKMTSLEKNHMIETIFSSSPRDAKRPTPSPYILDSFFAIFTSNRFVYSASVFCLVIILSGGAVFASADSLPGNKLYPLKVKVVEPLSAAFIFSPIGKIEYENKLAIERLVEAGILASEGRLDDSKKEELNFLLENHTTAFNNAVDKFYENNPKKEKPSEGEDSVALFESRMKVYPRILGFIVKPKDIEHISGENPEAIISMAAKEGVKETDDTKTQKKDEQKKTEYKGYKERKNAIQLLIDKTTNDILNQNTKENREDAEEVLDSKEDDVTPDNKESIEEPQETKEDDTNTEEKEEKTESVDSDDSMVEVETFLRSGLGL